MKTAAFDYELPPEMIAQHPVEPRDASRLLVLHRRGGRLEHVHFRDLYRYLEPGDLLVANESRVIPARLYGRKHGGGRVEVLLLRRLDEVRWQALMGGERIRAGLEIVLGPPDVQPSAEGTTLCARVEDVQADGTRVLAFDKPVEPYLDSLGVMPLPPYIREPPPDPARYQTIYARVAGSAAAPTAGLHFTPRLLQQLQEQGVRLAFVVLHIGLDTFRPIEVEEVEQHTIHAEWCQVPPEVVTAVRETRAAGRRVVAVGTTAVRALETAAQGGDVATYEGWTRLFIYPGYCFRAVDVLITNFHLPRSSLLLLVSAFGGRERILETYRQAIERGYRFYSFGDAMLIV